MRKKNAGQGINFFDVFGRFVDERGILNFRS